MKPGISARNMKAHLQKALDQHNPKRKIPKGMGGHDTAYLYHPKIAEKIQSHVGTMLFTRTKLGTRFWKTAVNKTLHSDAEIHEILNAQLKQVTKAKGISLAVAKKQMLADLEHGDRRYNKLKKEFDVLRNSNESVLTQTTDNGYRNNTQFFHMFIREAKSHYQK